VTDDIEATEWLDKPAGLSITYGGCRNGIGWRVTVRFIIDGVEHEVSRIVHRVDEDIYIDGRLEAQFGEELTYRFKTAPGPQYTNQGTYTWTVQNSSGTHTFAGERDVFKVPFPFDGEWTVSAKLEANNGEVYEASLTTLPSSTNGIHITGPAEAALREEFPYYLMDSSNNLLKGKYTWAVTDGEHVYTYNDEPSHIILPFNTRSGEWTVSVSVEDDGQVYEPTFTTRLSNPEVLNNVYVPMIMRQ
jgi:hypothetical protein